MSPKLANEIQLEQEHGRSKYGGGPNHGYKQHRCAVCHGTGYVSANSSAGFCAGSLCPCCDGRGFYWEGPATK
jgi:hypothetical protein